MSDDSVVIRELEELKEQSEVDSDEYADISQTIYYYRNGQTIYYCRNWER